MDELEQDIEFVNPPTYDYKCPICFELLKDAYQTACCGNHICSNCTERLKYTPNVKCPQCRHDNFEANIDKFFSRQLLNLEVCCYYYKEGCTWTGELRGLEQHVKTNCNKGVIKCKHCNSSFADVTAIEEHLPICGEIPIDCPNKCSSSKYKRNHTQYHLETECPLRVIVHSKGSIPYTANKIVQTVPLSFTMTNYMHYLESRDPWFSPPFYTHKQGYKIHLRVDANLHEQGNVSVVAFTTKGEYDHLLQWPLCAEIEVGLFDWRDNTSSYTKTLYLSGDYFCSMMSTEKLAEWGKGIRNFIPNDKLLYNPDKKTEYLQHNCLSFQVKRVTFLPNIAPDLPPWAVGNCLCQFTITSFTQFKQINASFYGPPFCTNLRGYKLIVFASTFNGFNTTKGTCMFLHARLMKGEYDDTLAWPFTGDVVVEILNWMEDKNHQEYTFSFHNGLRSTFINRVLNTDIAQSGCQQSVPYSALSYNHSKNTEFLRNDCIHIKVKSVDVYSSHSILKGPSWRHPSHNTQKLFQFVLTHFNKRKQHKSLYFSNPFSTHENGYKMQLRVDANRDGHGHIGVYVYLMKGPMDDFLLWPFHGDVVVELLNWREDNGHHSGVIELSSNASNRVCSRVTSGERGSEGWGKSQFIKHSSLEYNPSKNTQYLQDDCLLFGVKEVIVHSSKLSQKCPSWQNPQMVSPFIEFTVTNFSKRKDLGTTYISSVFLTHSSGYRLQLEVKAFKSNDDHHYVALYARILYGDNDHNLVCPFQADILVQLLNWRQNANHYNRIIPFNEQTPAECKSCVITGCSSNKFILCSKFNYNSTTNTEYLQNDCLRFKVKEVVVYSTPHCSKSPIWQNQKPTKFFEFTITQFSHRIRLKNTYFSPPFYTSACGYKMCLKVNAAGDVGTHVAIYGFLMKGEYDDSLSWPFCADIVIDILNWRGDHSHHREILHFNNDSCTDVYARVYDNGLAPKGCGNNEVIPLSELFPTDPLSTKYLEDDCMRIRIYDVALYNTPLLKKTPRWQNSCNLSISEFTVTEFHMRKMYDSVYLSPPFYTHKKGYKVRLEVYPNGCGDGKGTHISLFARLLKGKNDCNLKWPMNNIDLVIELINWRKDNSKILYTIPFANAVSGACNRVTGAKEKADSDWGTYKFCAHSTLYTATSRVQYIEDDCIRLRVKFIIIYNSSF